MGLWKGSKPTKYKEYTGADYADTEVVWDYHTVSDTLALNFKQGEYSNFYNTVPASEFRQLMGPDRALALLEQLADWCNTYEGPEKLDEIINRIRQK